MKDKSFWISFTIVCLLFICSLMHCHAQTAQYDTIVCHYEHINKFIEKPSNSGKSTRIFAVYTDQKRAILDFIPVSKSVYEYIMMCKEYKITPSLGIRLKNGEIYSIVRLKRKYVKTNIK